MSLTNVMYQTIVSHPRAEMTIDDIIQSMGRRISSGFNHHTVRVNMSKMATRGILIEKTGRRKGYSKIYRKREDIEDQWNWMEENKTPKGNLPTKAPRAQGAKGPSKESTSGKYNMVGDIVAKFFQDMQMQGISLSKFEDINNQIDQIQNRLERIEQLAQKNNELLQLIKEDTPRIIVRKEKA
jgi:hypothetical protein